MIIIHKNQGPKIDYIINNDQLIFGNKLTLHLAEYEKDFPVHLDICLDENGFLILGIGEKYVAEVDIGPRQYIYPKPNDQEEGEPSKSALPFDMERVTLTLWRMED